MALHPQLTIERQVSEALEEVRGLTRRESRREAARWIEEVGLPSFAPRAYPYQLSGGMQKRVLIAIALALGCRLLVADEPTAGLDPLACSEVLSSLLQAVSTLQAGLVLISHDLRLLQGAVDTLGVLEDGALVETGPTERLLSAPRHPQTKRLAEALAFLEGQTDAGTAA